MIVDVWFMAKFKNKPSRQPGQAGTEQFKILAQKTRISFNSSEKTLYPDKK